MYVLRRPSAGRIKNGPSPVQVSGRHVPLGIARPERDECEQPLPVEQRDRLGRRSRRRAGLGAGRARAGRVRSCWGRILIDQVLVRLDRFGLFVRAGIRFELDDRDPCGRWDDDRLSPDARATPAVVAAAADRPAAEVGNNLKASVPGFARHHHVRPIVAARVAQPVNEEDVLPGDQDALGVVGELLQELLGRRRVGPREPEKGPGIVEKDRFLNEDVARIRQVDRECQRLRGRQSRVVRPDDVHVSDRRGRFDFLSIGWSGGRPRCRACRGRLGIAGNRRPMVKEARKADHGDRNQMGGDEQHEDSEQHLRRGFRRPHRFLSGS